MPSRADEPQAARDDDRERRQRASRPSSTGAHTIANQTPIVSEALADPHELRHSLVHLGRQARSPRDTLATGGAGGQRVGDRQRAQRRLVGEVALLRRELLDLTLDAGQLVLDVEDVADLRGPGHDRLEGQFGGPQVRDAGIEVDDLAGHFDGLGVLVDAPSRRDREARRARRPSGPPESGT